MNITSLNSYSSVPEYPSAQARISNIPLDAQLILKNKRYGATITVPVPNLIQKNTRTLYTIPCFAKSDFSFSLGNTWTDLFPGVDSISSLVSQLINVGSIVEPLIPDSWKQNWGWNLGVDASQLAFKSREMKTQMWSGSQSPKFSVDCIFVCTTWTYNPIDPILALSGTCLPLRADQVELSNFMQKYYNTVDTVLKGSNDGSNRNTEANKAFTGIKNMIKNMGMAAPLGYGLEITEDGQLVPTPNSTCCLQIGQWFYATDLLVQDISNITFSKEVIAHTDFPLYATCTVTFTPYKPIFYDEFLNYFVIRNTDNITSLVLTEQSGLAEDAGFQTT